MAFDIKSLRKIRKGLGLTQHQFAKQAGVSQSLIAKVETGKLDPTYSKVLKIEEALRRLSKQEEVPAGRIMTKNIITCGPDELVVDIVKTMRKRGISQVPVLDGDRVVGVLLESSLMDVIGREDVGKVRARDVMNYPPPSVSPKTGVSVVSAILHHYPLVLVLEKGKLAGLVTKADVLKVLT